MLAPLRVCPKGTPWWLYVTGAVDILSLYGKPPWTTVVRYYHTPYDLSSCFERICVSWWITIAMWPTCRIPCIQWSRVSTWQPTRPKLPGRWALCHRYTLFLDHQSHYRCVCHISSTRQRPQFVRAAEIPTAPRTRSHGKLQCAGMRLYFLIPIPVQCLRRQHALRAVVIHVAPEILGTTRQRAPSGILHIATDEGLLYQ